jgi:hypothetical protein
MHQSGQHTEADAVGQPVGPTAFTIGSFVGHRCKGYVKYVAAQYFYEPI